MLDTMINRMTLEAILRKEKPLGDWFNDFIVACMDKCPASAEAAVAAKFIAEHLTLEHTPFSELVIAVRVDRTLRKEKVDPKVLKIPIWKYLLVVAAGYAEDSVAMERRLEILRVTHREGEGFDAYGRPVRIDHLDSFAKLKLPQRGYRHGIVFDLDDPAIFGDAYRFTVAALGSIIERSRIYLMMQHMGELLVLPHITSTGLREVYAYMDMSLHRGEPRFVPGRQGYGRAHYWDGFVEDYLRIDAYLSHELQFNCRVDLPGLEQFIMWQIFDVHTGFSKSLRGLSIATDKGRLILEPLVVIPIPQRIPSGREPNEVVDLRSSDLRDWIEDMLAEGMITATELR
jgi:hypothetical protein